MCSTCMSVCTYYVHACMQLTWFFVFTIYTFHIVVLLVVTLDFSLSTEKRCVDRSKKKRQTAQRTAVFKLRTPSLKGLSQRARSVHRCVCVSVLVWASQHASAFQDLEKSWSFYVKSHRKVLKF